MPANPALTACFCYLVSRLLQPFRLVARWILALGRGTASSSARRPVGTAIVGLSGLVLLAGWGPATELRANLVVYESFAYPNGGLEGNNGGFGQWSSPWQARLGTPTTVNSGAANVQVLDNGVGNSIRRMFAPTLGSTGATTWLRLSSQYSTTEGTSGAAGGLSLIDEDYNEKLRVGKFIGTSGESNWAIGHGTTAVDAGVSLLTSADLWVRIQHQSGNDSIRFWVNPADTSSEAGLNASSFSELTSLDIVGVRGLRLFGNPGSNPNTNPTQTWRFDNLRVGSSFGAMSAVPEPASGCLVAGAVMFLLARRRRGITV